MAACDINKNNIKRELLNKVNITLTENKFFNKLSDNEYELSHPALSSVYQTLAPISNFSSKDEIYKNYPFKTELTSSNPSIIFNTLYMIYKNNIDFEDPKIKDLSNSLFNKDIHSEIINEINTKVGENTINFIEPNVIQVNISDSSIDRYMMYSENAGEYFAEKMRNEYLAQFKDARNLESIDEFINHPAINTPTLQKLINFALKINPNFRIGVVDNLDQNAVSLLADHLILLRSGHVDELPEEISHFYVALLDDENPHKKELLKEVLNHPIYQETFDKYKNNPLYQINGKVDTHKIKLEAAAKLIAKYINAASNLESEKTFGKRKSILQRIINSIIKFIRRKINSTYPIYNESIFENSAKDILGGVIDNLNNKNLEDLKLNPYKSMFYSVVEENMPEDYDLPFLRKINSYAINISRKFYKDKIGSIPENRFPYLIQFLNATEFNRKYNNMAFQSLIDSIGKELGIMEETEKKLKDLGKSEDEIKQTNKIDDLTKFEIIKYIKNAFINISQLPIAIRKATESLKPESHVENLSVLNGFRELKEYFSEIYEQTNNFIENNSKYFDDPSGIDLKSILAISKLEFENIEKQINSKAVDSLLEIIREMSSPAFEVFDSYIQELAKNSTIDTVKELHKNRLLTTVRSMDQVKDILTGDFRRNPQISDVNTVQALTFMISSATEIGDAPIVSMIKYFFEQMQIKKMEAIVEQQRASEKIDPLLNRVIENGFNYYDIFSKMQKPFAIDNTGKRFRMHWVTKEDRIAANLILSRFDEKLQSNKIVKKEIINPDGTKTITEEEVHLTENEKNKIKEERQKFLEKHFWREYTNEYYEFINRRREITKNEELNKEIGKLRQSLILLYEKFNSESFKREDFDILEHFEGEASREIREVQQKIISLKTKLTDNESKELDQYLADSIKFYDIDVEKTNKLVTAHESIWIKNKIEELKNDEKMKGRSIEQIREEAKNSYTRIYKRLLNKPEFNEQLNLAFKSMEKKALSKYYTDLLEDLKSQKRAIIRTYTMFNGEIFYNSLMLDDNEKLSEINNSIEEIKSLKRNIDNWNREKGVSPEHSVTYFLLHLYNEIVINQNFNSILLNQFFDENELKNFKDDLNAIITINLPRLLNDLDRGALEVGEFNLQYHKLLGETFINALQKKSNPVIKLNGFINEMDHIIDLSRDASKALFEEVFIKNGEGVNKNQKDEYEAFFMQKQPLNAFIAKYTNTLITEGYYYDILLKLQELTFVYNTYLSKRIEAQDVDSESLREEIKLNEEIIERITSAEAADVQVLQAEYGTKAFNDLLDKLRNFYRTHQLNFYPNLEDVETKQKEKIIENLNRSRELSEKFFENFEKYHPIFVKDGVQKRKVSSFFTKFIAKNEEHFYTAPSNFLIQRTIKKEFTTPKLTEYDVMNLTSAQKQEYIKYFPSGEITATVDMNGNFLPKLAENGGADTYIDGTTEIHFKSKDYEELKKDKDLFNLYNQMKKIYYEAQTKLPDSVKPDILVPAKHFDKFEEKTNHERFKNTLNRGRDLISDLISNSNSSEFAQETGTATAHELEQYSPFLPNTIHNSNYIKLATKRYLDPSKQTKDLYSALMSFILDVNKYEAKEIVSPVANMMLSVLNATQGNFFLPNANKKRREIMEQFIQGSLYDNSPDSFFNNAAFTFIQQFNNTIGALSLGLFDYIGATVNYMGGNNLMFLRSVKLNSFKPFFQSKRMAVPYLIQLNKDLYRKDDDLSKRTMFLISIGAFPKLIDLSNKTSPFARFASIRENLLLPRTETEHSMAIELALQIMLEEGNVTDKDGNSYRLDEIFEDELVLNPETGVKELKLKDNFDKTLYDPVKGSYMIKLRNKITSWQTNIQGNYQEDTLANINRYKAGQLYMFMKKWFFPNMQYVLGFEAPNIFRNEIQGGYINTWYRLFKEFVKLAKETKSLAAPYDLAKSYWKTEFTRNNMKTSIAHFLLISAYGFVLSHILGFDSDDPDRYKKLRRMSKVQQQLILMTYKITSELGTMIPLPFAGLGYKEFANTALQPLRGPYNTALNLAKLAKYSGYHMATATGLANYEKELYYDKSYGFWFREKGDSKLTATLWKMIGVSGVRDQIWNKTISEAELKEYQGRVDTYLRQLQQFSD